MHLTDIEKYIQNIRYPPATTGGAFLIDCDNDVDCNGTMIVDSHGGKKFMPM
jgi:hypothetical protein